MHLKTLTLRGFKSFASATTLHMEPGITAVVGPNGSGKSNVVDALAWVMGEQGAKSLRGANMADVIFAGTASRPALGRAEVKLTIDNSDGALPIDYTEVTISRTLFRGGGSEYSINGTPCRLLDIQELLSDTGMGRQMHVIVGQGQLDAVLTATPEERRGFIEEAAGVLKHRRRKERAERKLENMAANLHRLEDLTAEIRRQLGPLARQAEVARRAGLIQATVRDARSRILADDIVQLRDSLAAQGAGEEQLLARRTEIGEVIAKLRAELTQLETQAVQGAPQVEAATQMWQSLTAVHERLRSVESIATERLRALAVPITYEGSVDPDELQRRAEAATAQDGELLKELESAHEVLAKATKQREAAEETERQKERELADINRARADHRENLARLAGRVSSANSRLEAAQGEKARMEESLSEATARLEQARQEAADTPKVADADEGPALWHAQAVEKVDQLRELVDQLVAKEREAEADRATWASRRDTLALSLRPSDGTGDLLDANLPGVLGSLPTTMSVPAKWQGAVAAAFGAHADAAVVESVAVAVDAIRHARSHEDAGQVRLVVAKGGACKENAGKLPPGAVWANDTVKVKDGQAQAVVKALLCGVALVEDLALGRQLVEGGAARAVATKDGDFLSQTVATGGGQVDQNSVLALHAAFEEAQVEAQSAAERAHRANSELVKARSDFQQASQVAAQALQALRAADAENAALAQQAARVGAAVRSAEAEVQRITKALSQIEKELGELGAKAEEAAQALREFEGQGEGESDPQAATAARDLAAQETAQARASETEARLKLRTLEERSTSAKDRARSLRMQAAREREAAQLAAKREAKRQVRYQKMEKVAAWAAQATRAAASSLELAGQKRAQAEAVRLESSTQITHLREQIDEQNSRLAELTDAAHRGEVARAEVKARLTQMEQLAQEELGVEPDDLISEYGPHNLVPVLDEGGQVAAEETVPYVREQQEKRLAKAARDLDKLGKVNPLALEEHAALTQRYEFLTGQLNDLKRSRSDLRQIITEVDQKVLEVFTQAFEDTQKAFAHVFDQLFPGGEGRLVLTDPDDMLTTGIEIEARPAGKKVKRLSLLSGGERSLAALALLLAIFKARPSPFYVLDEVEAALDDSNLSRLLEMLKELREESQLIVVTHQKRTMEIADALYGVTMRSGVTTVVSQRLAEESQ